MTARRRVLLAPVTITPSKPLTPSHLKGLLWTDVMYRATAHLAEVSYRYSHTTYDPTEQTLGFWEYLDRAVGRADYSGLTEEEIGELYVAYRAERRHPPATALRPYAEAVERYGWRHPAGERVLEIWASHYARLGLHDPGLTEHQPPGLSLTEMLDRIGELGICLDHRPAGGPVYLDLTRHGLPLRQIVTPDGQPNYLACALRELLPLATRFDEVVLLYDKELDPDYQLLARVLGRLGPQVRRTPIGRVPIDGRITSARHGNWHATTAGALLRACSQEHDAAAVRLGMRLYFIATLGPGQQQSFRRDLLHQCITRAERLLSAARATQPDTAGMPAALARHRRDHVYVDPYRLTSSLLGKRRPAPPLDLISSVFL
ncbi:hypothetical protein ACTPOK_11345 [Streptomyces inhibens]|uniref:hypothetical protein n=1 Tax=Streptomyces inhibens TaxID=2293571 RepID=UPI00402ABB56